MIKMEVSMNKKILFAVTIIVLAALFLASTALADSGDGTCLIRWLAYDWKGNVVERTSVPGSFSVVRNDTKIATTCSGIVPFGETYVYKNHVATRCTLSEMCAYCGSCQTEHLLVLSYDDIHQEASITDPVIGVTYYTQDWSLRANSSGNFRLEKVYFVP